MNFLIFILKSRDRWDYYQDYLRSCFELLKVASQSSLTEKTNNEIAISELSTLDECHDFLCQVCYLCISLLNF